MTAADNTFDLVPPNRPSLADVGGATKVDDAIYPPNPVTMPTSAEFNLLEKLVAAYGKVMPVARFSVTGGAVPVISLMQCLATAPVIATFTCALVGTGDVSITWPAGTFPTSTNNPQATINSTSGSWLAPIAFSITNGVEVVTRNSAGALTNSNFTVDVFG